MSSSTLVKRLLCSNSGFNISIAYISRNTVFRGEGTAIFAKMRIKIQLLQIDAKCFEKHFNTVLAK